MGGEFSQDTWALVLGGSSGFGLATSQKLAEHGMNIIAVHRDRRGAMKRIEPEFEKIRGTGVQLLTFNVDALSAEIRAETLDEIAKALGESGKIRVLLHSIAFGNLKLVVPEPEPDNTALEALAKAIDLDVETLQSKVNALFDAGIDGLEGVASAPEYSATTYIDEEDLARTIHSMGTSLLGWTQEVHSRGLFAADARVFGLTSEGNALAWKGYTAVAAAKVALESISRSIAVEFASYGVRCNVIQAGVTDTPALRAIPGNPQLKANARMRNPMKRLTTPEDVAGVIYLLSKDEAGWVNGEVIRVDGGEHISGVTR